MALWIRTFRSDVTRCSSFGLHVNFVYFSSFAKSSLRYGSPKRKVGPSLPLRALEAVAVLESVLELELRLQYARATPCILPIKASSETLIWGQPSILLRRPIYYRRNTGHTCARMSTAVCDWSCEGRNWMILAQMVSRAGACLSQAAGRPGR